MKKNNLDEMQEQKMLQLEHTGFWLAFWGLVADITIQVMMGGYLDHIMGEAAVLTGISVYMIFGCLKHGIWDRRLKPNLKTNLLCSLAAGIFLSASFYFRFRDMIGEPGILLAVCLTGMGSGFVLVLGALTLCTVIYKKRREKLDRE